MKMEDKEKPVFSILCGCVGFILLLLLDRVTKQWAVLRLRGQEPITVIRGVFQLYYLENHGAAFGILQGRQTVFIVITVLITAVILYVYARLPFLKKYRMLRVFLVLIASGAIGNFIDRVSQNYVVDFFYFVLIDFPVFNVADIYVTCSTILLIFVVLFRLKDDDMTDILKHLRLREKDEKKTTGLSDEK